MSITLLVYSVMSTVRVSEVSENPHHCRQCGLPANTDSTSHSGGAEENVADTKLGRGGWLHE